MSKYGGRNLMPIELYKEGEFVHWFPCAAKAAEWIGVPQSRISDSIRRGIKTSGYEVRIGKSVADTVKEIESRTYQFTRP